MQIKPMSANVGAEITGVQIAGLDENGVAAIRSALAAHGVLHIRDQELSPDQHIAFAKSCGGIDVNHFFPANGAYPEIAEVRKAEAQTTNIGGRSEERRVGKECW